MLKGSIPNLVSGNVVDKYLKVYLHIFDTDENASNAEAVLQLVRRFIDSIQQKMAAIKVRLLFKQKLLSSPTSSSSYSSSSSSSSTNKPSKHLNSSQTLLKQIEASLFQIEQLESHISEISL